MIEVVGNIVCATLVTAVICAWALFVGILHALVDMLCERLNSRAPHYFLSAVALVLLVGYIMTSIPEAPR